MNEAVVLGAGQGQVPFINLCHKYGWSVTCVSPSGNYPGLGVADNILDADVRDCDAVLSYCRAHKVGAVLSDQLDAAVLTAARVNNDLGLRGVSPRAAELFTNKFEMRRAAKAAGVAVPRAAKAATVEDAISRADELGYPLMIKPVDSAASRGVYEVFSAEDVANCFSDTVSYSRMGEVILEGFVCGREYVVESITLDGKTTVLVVGTRSYFDVEGAFIPYATVFVDANSVTSEIERRVVEADLKLVESFAPGLAITHGEFIYNEKEDEVYLVEIAARGGGVFISSDLIPGACGVNANDLLVRAVLTGEVPDVPALQSAAAAYFCYLLPEGEVVTATGFEEAAGIKGVTRVVSTNVERGMRIGSPRDKTSRKGPILVQGRSKEDCWRIREQVMRTVNVEVLTGHGIKHAIWS